MRTSHSTAAAMADMEMLARAVERAGWALGCIDVEEHDAWLRERHKGEQALFSRVSDGFKRFFGHAALVFCFVML